MRVLVVDTPMAEALWPRFERCACGAEILHARFRNGRQVVLDATPVIVGIGPCSTCRGKGTRVVREPAKVGVRPGLALPGDLFGKTSKGTRTACTTCGGTGVRGEHLNGGHVVMRPDGMCRSRPVMAESWDSAYRRHRCA